MHVLVTFPANDEHKRKLEALVPDWTLVYAHRLKVTAEDVRPADIILGNVPIAVLPFATRLSWIQLSSAGANGYTDPGVLPPKALLTCSSGAFGMAVSEHLLALLLVLTKNLGIYRDSQSRGEWHRTLPTRTIHGSTILVVGLGDLGGTFASHVRSMGAYVIGVRRTVGAKPDCVDELHPAEALDALLPRADFVAITLPGMPSTNRMFDASRIARMKQGAYLLNVGRGSVVDTDALVAALESGHLAGAGLDVFEEEPLPSGHRLWQLPQVVLTPHTAGGFQLPATVESIFDILVENLVRFRSGRPLFNLIDIKTGNKVVTDDRNRET